MRRPAKLVSLCCLLTIFSWSLYALNPASGINHVTISRTSFNPSLNQSVTLSIALCCSGQIDIEVLDRDSYVVRQLVSNKAVEAGHDSEIFDGKDDGGLVLPDEAYSFRINFHHDGKTDVYDPAANFTPIVETPSDPVYARLTGALTYTLKRASRVHLQIGISKKDPKTGKSTGPVLANLVDREPRAAGRVVESWSGFINDGDIFIPDKPNFFVAILATSLPENSVILSGNNSWVLPNTPNNTGPVDRKYGLSHERRSHASSRS